jgi:hypothetical protein
MVSKVALRILKKYLEGGKRTTEDIYVFLNDRIKMGITQTELAFLLKKVGINNNEDENDEEQKDS